MKLSYAHTGIPTTRHLGGMRYAPPMKLWISDPALSPDGIEYLFFEDESPAPEMMKSTTHVALTTDDLDAAAAWCDEVVLGPFEDEPAPGVKQDVLFARKDDLLIEFCCPK